MNPTISSKTFTFATLKDPIYMGEITPICQFIEAEGISVILDKSDADKVGLGSSKHYRMITLNVFSDLEAVGFLATIATLLAAALIPCNAISAFHHDYLFVPAERGDAAMHELSKLVKSHDDFKA